MGFCSDANLCRPVHGIEVTGGSFPAQIWNAYMQQAVAEMEIEEFVLPTDMPDEVINEAPPPEPSPTESKTPKPKPTDEPTPDPGPSEEPTPDPEPTEPAPTPTSEEGLASALAGVVLVAWVRRKGPP
jgi:outer membrane biosynthesis protein TonB